MAVTLRGEVARQPILTRRRHGILGSIAYLVERVADQPRLGAHRRASLLVEHHGDLDVATT